MRKNDDIENAWRPVNVLRQLFMLRYLCLGERFGALVFQAERSSICWDGWQGNAGVYRVLQVTGTEEKSEIREGDFFNVVRHCNGI